MNPVTTPEKQTQSHKHKKSAPGIAKVRPVRVAGLHPS